MHRPSVLFALFLALGVSGVAGAADVPFAPPEAVPGGTAGLNTASIWVDIDRDGDLDVVNARAGLRWSENNGRESQSWQVRTIDPDSSSKQYIAHGDLDGDGDPDLVVSQLDPDGVFWYENDGATPWTKRAVSSLPNPGARVFYVGTADLDADGDLDVVAADPTNAAGNLGLSWYENDGAPVPGWTRRVLSTGPHDGASVADFDADGDLDVLSSTNDCFAQPTLFESDGLTPPTFTPRVVGNLTAEIGFQSAAGDLDGDGDLDFVIATSSCNSGGRVLWFESDGGATPTFTERLVSNLAGRRVDLEDFDLDGDLDIVTAGQGGILYFENDGASPPSWTERVTPEPSASLYWSDVADFDRDGDADVLTHSSSGDTFVVANRTIHRSGRFPTRSVIADTAPRAIGVFAADVDGDGDMDALSASIDDDTVAWYENDGTPSPGWTRRVISDTVGGAYSVYAADVDGDGDMDALSTGFNDNTVSWHENTSGSIALDVVNSDFELLYKAGSTTVTSPVFSALAAAGGSSPIGMNGPLVTFSDSSTGSVFDLPGWDWDTSLGITNVNARFAATEARDMVLWINGYFFNGGPDPHLVTQVLSASLEQDVLYTLTTDFGWRTDNAGPSVPTVLELYAGNTLLTPIASSSPALIQGAWVTHSRTYLVSNPSISGPLKIEFGLGANMDGRQLNIDRVTLRKEDDAAPPSWTKHIITGTALGTRNVVAADVDGDGDIDALSASEDDDTIAWYENDGASPPGWTERIITTTADAAIAVFAADVDADGDIDALSASQQDDTIAWYENDGASPPSWTRRVISDIVDNAFSVYAADVDGDGDIDALSASQPEDLIAWYENDGASPPSWTQRTISDTADIAISVVAADMDADGDLDVVSAANGDEIAWYVNNGASPPSWTQQTITNSAILARTVFVADVNGDGALDVLSASDGDDTVAWYQNQGGQFTNTAADCIAGPVREGEEVALFSVDVVLNGRPGDSPGRTLSTVFDLGLEPGPLSTVIETLRLYRDDGSGTFEADQDIHLGALDYDVLTFAGGVGGLYQLSYPAGDPNGIVAGPARFFLTGLVNPDASTSGFTSINVANQTGNTVLVDANASTLELSEEDTSAVSPCNESRTIVKTFAVDDTNDAVDANPGDGICATAGATCTLRAAIVEANASPGEDNISLPAGTYALTLSGNDDASLVGDLDILEALTIVGAGAELTIIDGAAGGDRVFDLRNGGIATIDDLTVTGGTGTVGGGVRLASSETLELKRCIVRGNVASADGGGFHAAPGSFLQLVDTRVVGNATNNKGGGINSGGTVNLVWTEISGNSAGNGGGGIYTDGVLQVLASTLSGNDAGSGSGGGVQSDGLSMAFEQSTIAQNVGAAGGGGIFAAPGNNVNFINSILADNNGGSNDCQGSLGALEYNIIKNPSGCSVTVFPGSSVLNVDPLLAPLGDFGGPTLTHRLLAGSPAIDAGSCVGLAAERDQTGQARPVDDLDAPNVAGGCDIGAYEARIGQTQPVVEVPIRWCGVRGAPSVEDPGLVGQSTVNDVLRRRHEAASDEIFLPQAGIVLRSGGNFIIEDYPILDAPACEETSPGVFNCDDARQAGDVVLNLETGDFSEFQNLVAACRQAWEELDPNIHGITAVHVNRFIDPDGGLLDIIGVGGRAPFGDAVEQFVAGRVMVVDNVYRIAANPPDTNDRLFGHEMGHALSLLHGNGIDDDLDQLLDNNDERAVGQPRFDGPNLLQYRNGDQLTPLQALQMRIHALVAIPGSGLEQFSDSIAAGSPIDEETDEILQWGFRALLELEQDEILQFEQDEILQFEEDEILQWEEDEILQWEEDEILQWEEDEILQWEQDEILQFGATFDGDEPTDRTTFHISLAELPWPASVRPDTRFYFYLDMDSNDNTGGYPANFPIPGDAPNSFPGVNNLVGSPPVGAESGVDIILEVVMTSDCPGGVCSSFAEIAGFDFNDTLQAYETILSGVQLDLTAYGLGLYRETGGGAPELDDVPIGYTVRATVENSVLFAAGWGFQSGPNGPVPNPIGMEALSTVECSGRVLNTDPASADADCVCTDCIDCGPNYPGCGADDPEPKTPRVLSGSRIVVDQADGEVTFEPPVLPRAAVAPVLAAEGQTVTVYVLDLPTDVDGQVEVTLGGEQVGVASTSAIDANGAVSVIVTLPFGKLGDQTLSSGIVGFAPRASTVVTIAPSLPFPDNDGDGDSDEVDTDDDDDGVDDVTENTIGSDPLNPFDCGDRGDFDGCNDCYSGSFDPLNDGPDPDFDGVCDPDVPGLISTEEKVKVKFDRKQDGTMMEEEEEEGAPSMETPHCLTRIDLDGELQLGDTSKLPVDVRGPGNLDVDVRMVVSLSGQPIYDETLMLEVKSEDDEKWEYKREGGAPKEGVKKLKLDWKETASYDSHQDSGLGDDVPRIETKFIGFDETDADIDYKEVARPFQLRFVDPVGGTFLIDMLDDDGSSTTTPAGDFDLKAKKDKLSIVLPFRLTPQTAVTLTTDGGQTETAIPVDTEYNYQPAGAKYKLDLDETASSFALCTDELTPVNSLSSPQLEIQLVVGSGPAAVQGAIQYGPDPADWDRLDDREWKRDP